MARNRRITVRSKDKGAYMATRTRKNRGRNRRKFKGGNAAGSSPQRTSKRETSNSPAQDSSRNSEEVMNSYSTTIPERVRRILEEFFQCSVLSDAVQLSASIIEREKDGISAYELTVILNHLKRSPSSSLAEVIENGKHLISCAYSPWGARQNSGANDGMSSSNQNFDRRMNGFR